MPTKKTARSRGRPTKEPSPFGEKPNLTDKQWRGLEREFLAIKDQHQSDGWPSHAMLHAVAKAAGVTVRAVRQWRDDPEYLRGLWWLTAERLTAKIAADDPKESDSNLTRQHHAALLHVFVKSKWTGSVQSPIDQKVYLSIDDYVAHLIAAGDSRAPALTHDVVPWLGELVKKKSE